MLGALKHQGGQREITSKKKNGKLRRKFSRAFCKEDNHHIREAW